LPDPRRPLRRFTEAGLLNRVVAHVAVVALVGFSAALGIASIRPSGASNGENAFGLVSMARGAASDQALRSAHFNLQPNPEAPDLMLSRRVVPTPVPTPRATPVALPRPAVGMAAPPSGGSADVAVPRPGSLRGTGALMWPVPGGIITQYFSAWHLALDIAAPTGSRVVASDSGTVVSAGWRSNGGGLVVEIDHGNGIHTVYNHLGAIWVSVGQQVPRGAGIAAIGCTGLCTGPHTHFEVVVDGIAVNPLRYL